MKKEAKQKLIKPIEENKRKEFIQYFKKASKDKNMKKLAEEGLDDYSSLLNKY